LSIFAAKFGVVLEAEAGIENKENKNANVTKANIENISKIY